MKTLQEINESLERVHIELNKKIFEMEIARTEYQHAKAIYENEYSKYLLETKMKCTDWTVQEIKAKTITLSYPEKLGMIKAESQYRSLSGELKGLYTEHDGLREQAFNLRAELKRL